MSASIEMSLGISCILNDAVCFRDLEMSIFAGAIQISIIISLIKHPFIGICIGGFAGFIIYRIGNEPCVRARNNKQLYK